MLTGFFDTIFGFMLNWPAYIAVIALAFLVSVIIVLVYKLMTNQQEMKQLKGDLKEFQKKMKSHKGNPEKLMKLQKEAMGVNMTYMRKSMKPTLITFLPILLIFGWMNAHFAYAPLEPGAEFSLTATLEEGINSNVSIEVPEGLTVISDTEAEIIDNKATFRLKGEEGEYYATLKHDDTEEDKHIIVTTEPRYAEVTSTYDGPIESITLGNDKLRVLWGLTWIWIYIIFAILFSTTLRKVLKVH